MYRPRSVIRTIIGVLVAILLVTLILGLVFSYPNWFNGTNVQWPSDFISLIVGLLVAVIIIGIMLRIVFAIIFGPTHYHRYRRWGWEGPWGQDAEDVLDQRYARGEITREQYNQMREDLYKSRQSGGPYERPR